MRRTDAAEPEAGRQPLLTLTLTSAFFLVAMNILIVPALLSFMSATLHMSWEDRAALLIGFPLLSFVGNLLFGPFIDRLSSRRFILLGAAGCTVTFLLTCLAHNAEQVVALRAITGLFAPMIGASVFTSVSDYFPADQRMTVTGYVASAAAAAQLVTLPLGVLVSGYFSWRLAFAALAVLGACVFTLTLVFLPARRLRPQETRGLSMHEYPRTIASLAGNRMIASFFAAYASYGIALVTMLSLYPTWILAGQSQDRHGIRNATLLLVVGGAVGVAGSVLTGRLRRPLDARPALLCLAAAAPAAVVLGMPTLPGRLTAQVALFAAVSALQAVMVPLLRSLMNNIAPLDLRGTLNGLWNAGWQIASAAGGALGALLYGVSATFWLNAAVAATFFLLAGWALTPSRTAVQQAAPP